MTQLLKQQKRQKFEFHIIIVVESDPLKFNVVDISLVSNAT